MVKFEDFPVINSIVWTEVVFLEYWTYLKIKWCNKIYFL